MKQISLLFAAFLVTANASRAASPPLSEESLEAQSLAQKREAAVWFRKDKPNEIVAGHITYSGILVEALKIDDPFELIKQSAPAKYGSAEENLVRDPIIGKVSGLKIFSIQF